MAGPLWNHPRVISSNTPATDPAAKPKRRTFTPSTRIADEHDTAPKGASGAVLRRERLPDSPIKQWRARQGTPAPGCP